MEGCLAPEGLSIPFESDSVRLLAEYGDVAAFHGGRYPAGVALGFKALTLAQQLLFPGGGNFVRERCTVETPFPGGGFRDAAEMVLRSVSRDRYRLDLGLPVPQGTVPAPVEGHFFFRFLQDGGCAEFSLRPGLVPEEFYAVTEDLHHGRGDPEAVEARALELRRAIASAILALDPSELFVVHGARAAEVLPEGAEPPLLGDAGSLSLIDRGTYAVTVESLRRYHGNAALCGLCLVWSLVRQLGRHAGVDAFERRSVGVTAGARGPGILDGLEYLFRGFGEGRAAFDFGWAEGLGAPRAPMGSGAFAFRFALPGREPMTFVLKDRYVPHGYFALCERKAGAPGAFGEEPERRRLQLEFARLALSEPELFEVLP